MQAGVREPVVGGGVGHLPAGTDRSVGGVIVAELGDELVHVPSRTDASGVVELGEALAAVGSGVLVGALGDGDAVMEIDDAVAGVNVEGKPRSWSHVKLVQIGTAHVERITDTQRGIQAVLQRDRPVHLGVEIGTDDQITFLVL